MSMTIRDVEHHKATLAYAESLGAEALAQLKDKLNYLETFRDNTCHVELYKDFAPHSYGFTLFGPEKEREGREVWIQGGLIYHGPHDGGGSGGAPSFSVSLSGDTAPRWEVHT